MTDITRAKKATYNRFLEMLTDDMTGDQASEFFRGVYNCPELTTDEAADLISKLMNSAVMDRIASETRQAWVDKRLTKEEIDAAASR